MLDQGYRVLYEPVALASEETTEDYGREFGRRARIAAGNFQSLGLVPGLLSPFRGFPAFAFWSHKVLRWCAPALMLVALVANVGLLEQPFYQLHDGRAGRVLRARGAGEHGGRGRRLVRRGAGVAYYFVTMNLAIAVGFWRFLRNSQGAAWERTARARRRSRCGRRWRSRARSWSSGASLGGGSGLSDGGTRRVQPVKATGRFDVKVAPVANDAGTGSGAHVAGQGLPRGSRRHRRGRDADRDGRGKGLRCLRRGGAGHRDAPRETRQLRPGPPGRDDARGARSCRSPWCRIPGPRHCRGSRAR